MARRAKKALAKSQRPPQEVKESPRSWLYLPVRIIQHVHNNYVSCYVLGHIICHVVGHFA